MMMRKKAIHKCIISENGTVDYFCETARYFPTAECTISDEKVTCKKCLLEMEKRNNRKNRLEKAYENLFRIKDELKRQKEEKRVRIIDKVIAYVVKLLLLILSFFSIMTASYGLSIDRPESALVFFIMSIVFFMVREMV